MPGLHAHAPAVPDDVLEKHGADPVNWLRFAFDVLREVPSVIRAWRKPAEPKVPPHPLPRDLLHIDDQIDRATEDFKVTSPRAIVPTQMRPPPRKPRQ